MIILLFILCALAYLIIGSVVVGLFRRFNIFDFGDMPSDNIIDAFFCLIWVLFFVVGIFLLIALPIIILTQKIIIKIAGKK